MRKARIVGLTLLLLLALLLAACDSDDGDDAADSEAAATPTVESAAPDDDADGDDSTADAGGFNPGGAAISLGSSGASSALDIGLPGCSDPDDEACPAALQMTLDGEVAADGVTIQYPERYFNPLTGADAPDDVLIRIEPSENNRYAEEAVFAIYFAESVDAALESLEDPETVEWTTDSLTGQIGVSKDAEQEPPVNTTIGAFETEGGRVIVLELSTTGKYGWDLWLLVYRDMLETITVAPADAP